MKLVVFGTSEFAVPTLEALARDHDVVGVVTQPDRPAGRGHKLTPTPVKRAAERLGLPVFTPEKLRPFVDEARGLGADAFVVVSYGRIIPQALLDLVPIAYNIHPSLLPLYRGATPLQSAIRDGRTETAITIIAMDAGMDTGDVLLQQRYSIGLEETYGELHDRLARESSAIIAHALTLYPDRFDRRPQTQVARELGISEDEIAQTMTHPLRKEDLVIDWSLPRARVIDLVRSLSPQPLARTTSVAGGETLKILSVRPVDSSLPPVLGIFIGINEPPTLEARCGDGKSLEIERLIAPNRGPMTGTEYVMRWTEQFARRMGRT